VDSEPGAYGPEGEGLEEGAGGLFKKVRLGKWARPGRDVERKFAFLSVFNMAATVRRFPSLSTRMSALLPFE